MVDVPGLRRLRDVGSKISGALAGARDEVTDTTPPAAEPAATTSSPPTTEGAPPAAVQEDPVPALETPVELPSDDVPSEPDAVAAAAVDLARAVAVEVAGDAVGEHLGVDPEPAADGFAVTHSFATREAGYVGWRWAVTVARAEGSDDVTVDEVVLLPGTGALLAPAWVPWDQRVQPGDLSPGDLLPPAENDLRLVPAYADVDDDELPFDLHRDLGLSRPRVLSLEGREETGDRWFDGPAGPGNPMSKQAPGRCVDCGFLVPLVGALGRGFGACANAMAPDDGRVVSLLHGCGAHSEQPTVSTTVAATGMAVEHEELEEIELVDVASLPSEVAETADAAEDSHGSDVEAAPADA
jgi:hypothetical protein